MNWPQPIVRAGRLTFDLEALRGDSMTAVLTALDIDDSTDPETVTPVNFTTAASAILEVHAVAGDGVIVLSASTAAGTLALGGSAGTVTFAVPAATMAAVAAGSYVYDLTITWNDGVIETLWKPAKFIILEHA